MQSVGEEGPIRVAFVTDLLSVGGAETQLLSLVKALDPNRIDARVAVLRPQGARLDGLEDIASGGAEAHGGTDPRPERPERCRERERGHAASDRAHIQVIGMRGAADPRTLPALSAWVRGGRFRAIYTTHLWSLVFSAILKEWLRPPAPQKQLVLIATEHSYRMRPASRRALVTLRRWALGRADRIIAIAQVQADWLREYYGPKAGPIEVIPNAIDPARFADLPDGTAVRAEFGIPDGAPTVVCVARLVPVKGIEILLSAMQVPVLQETGAHLLLVGDGPEEGALRERAQATGLAGRVHFAGKQADTRPFLAAAQVACLSSFSESQGIALLEAMAAELPVVASRVGGIPEMVGDDEAVGLLVRPGDPADLARALARALTDEAWREQAGKAGRERVERLFSIELRARRVESLIEELVGR